MSFPLGRYGDNHVSPDELFDPAAEPPPYDAIDVQFRCPVSLSMMLDGMAQADRPDLHDQWSRLYAELGAETAQYVQRGGRGIDAERSGLAPARLAVTVVPHAEVPRTASTRWHLHVYVGGTVISLLDGRVLEIAVDQLRRNVWGNIHARYAGRLRELTTQLWHVRWAQPRPGAVQEIVEPPWHQHIDSRDRGVCPGPKNWGARNSILADEQDLRVAERDEDDMARADAEGRGWRESKLLYEDEVLPTHR